VVDINAGVVLKEHCVLDVRGCRINFCAAANALSWSGICIAVKSKYSARSRLSRYLISPGVSGAIADSACGYAAYTLMSADSSVLTVEYEINLMAPADGEELIARARVLRSGKTLKICAADIYVRKGEAETHCATMLATVMCLPGKSDHPK